MAVNWPDSGPKLADKAGVSRARSDKPGIARYRLDHRVHLTTQHLLREAEREALRAHRLRHFGEVRVLEVHAEGHEARLLHLDLDEVERLIVEDDLDHRHL